MRCSPRNWLAGAACIITLASLAQAKTLTPPSLEDMLRSEVIVVAEFLDVIPPAHPSNFDYTGVPAHFRRTRILRGEALSETLLVRYDFSDGSFCIPPQSFDYRTHLPRRGERFVLFLSYHQAGEWFTYGGDYGRWSGADSVVKRATRMIREHHS